RKAIRQKPANDPERLPSFSYNAYNKLFMTMEGYADSVATPLMDSLAAPPKDSVEAAALKKKQDARKRLKYFAERNHLFVTESYTERKFTAPNFTKETVLANKMTGVKDPFFAFLATDFQPFSFYKDFISLFGKNYLNPASEGTFDRYDFTLIDTVYHATDSVFIITFEPLPGKQFEALKGQLYISSDGFAIEHVIAEPADDGALIAARIQQKYAKVEGKWFPIQLNTELRFKEYKIGLYNLIYVSRSYLTNIRIGEAISKKNFGILNVEFDPDANQQNENYWNLHRTDSLGSKEKNTYHLYDSLGPKLKSMNRMMNLSEGFILGRFKAGAFYIPLEHLIKFNKYEGVRVGMGLRTSESISKFFTFEVYGAYGFQDQALKYGGSLQFNLIPNKDVVFRFSYLQDIIEPGNSDFIKTFSLFNNQSFRNWIASRMDSVQQLKVEFGFRPIRFSQMNIFLRHQTRNPAYVYSFITEKDLTGQQKQYVATEVGFQYRFAFKETFTQIGNGRIVTGTSFPQINLFVSRGISGFWDGHYDFTKMEIQVDQRWITRGLGKTIIQLNAGQVVGEVPYSFLFNGKGSRYDNTVLDNFLVNNYFQTMGLYEFTSDQFGYLFLNHNFGRIAGAHNKYFRPEFAIVQNIGYGSLGNKHAHLGTTFNTMEKGFYESGIVLDNIFRFKYVHLFYYGIGVGAFYRYGSYALSEPIDNFALKINITASF
ncbi:MAG TPA: DUF5686 family protein, partial [Cyclobacteriaceae bacterium]|nr:DUF5686 family protein [Cyclobacteriaceae bacterium]